MCVCFTFTVVTHKHNCYVLKFLITFIAFLISSQNQKKTTHIIIYDPSSNMKKGHKFFGANTLRWVFYYIIYWQMEP